MDELSALSEEFESREIMWPKLREKNSNFLLQMEICFYIKQICMVFKLVYAKISEEFFEKLGRELQKFPNGPMAEYLYISDCV